MYNRYIPQSDGSYRRSRVQDPKPAPPPPPREEPVQKPCPSPEPERKPEPPVQKPPRPRCQRQNSPPPRPIPHPPRQEGSVLTFLKQLLPKDFDTSDFLVVILLLLMSGDCAEDQNTALLTLALYLFM